MAVSCVLCPAPTAWLLSSWCLACKTGIVLLSPCVGRSSCRHLVSASGQNAIRFTAVKVSWKGRGLDLCGRSGPSTTCSSALVSEAKGSKGSNSSFYHHIGQSLLGSCLAWDKVFYPLRAGRHCPVPVFPAPTSTFLGPTVLTLVPILEFRSLLSQPHTWLPFGCFLHQSLLSPGEVRPARESKGKKGAQTAYTLPP